MDNVYNTGFIQQILSDLDMNWHSEEKSELERVGLLTLTDFEKINEFEQIEMAMLLNPSTNNESLSQQELLTICGWSWILPDGKMNNNILTAANWAHQRGGEVGVSQVSYERWHKMWQTYCEERGPLSQVDITSERETQDLWSFLDDKLYQREIRNMEIGGNSSLRCWFLSILYFLIGEENFMTVLYTWFYIKKEMSHLDNIYCAKFYKALKIGILTQHSRLLDMVTEFVECLLQGHYCRWGEFGSVETGFKILRRMAPAVFNIFVVQFKHWSECSSHQRFEETQHTAFRLGFDHPTDWDEESGHITHYTQFDRECETINCRRRSSDRIYEVVAPQRNSYIMFFRSGLPAPLWRKIMGGRLIYFGECARQIGGAIFQVGTSHFVAAYLLCKQTETKNETKVWYKMETLHSKIERLRNARAEDLRFMFQKRVVFVTNMTIFG